MMNKELKQIRTFLDHRSAFIVLKQRTAQQRAPGKPLLQPGQLAPPASTPPGTDIDARFRQTGSGPGTGLSREELAQVLPHLADKFSEIDSDRDGRVTIVELQNYWQRNPQSAPGGAGAAPSKPPDSDPSPGQPPPKAVNGK